MLLKLELKELWGHDWNTNCVYCVQTVIVHVLEQNISCWLLLTQLKWLCGKNNNSKVVSAERGEDFLMMVFVYQMTKCREVATSCGLFCTGQVSGLWLTCALLHDKNIKTRHTSKFKRGNTSKKLLFCLMSLIHSHYPMAGFTDLLRQIMSL